MLARGPKTLLVGRRLIEDPRSAWRTVGGITLAGFVAGFLTITSPQDVSSLTGPSNRLDVLVPASDSPDLANEARGALRKAGVHGLVSVTKADEFVTTGTAARALAIRVGDAYDLDRARTAVLGISPWLPPASSETITWDVVTQTRDLSSASLLVLAVTLGVASASAAITGVTGVLDRRKTFGLLRLAGTPLAILDGARLRETLAPLIVLGGGAMAAGVLCALPLAASAELTLDPRSFPKLGALVLLAALGVALAEICSGLSLRLARRQGTAHRE